MDMKDLESLGSKSLTDLVEMLNESVRGVPSFAPLVREGEAVLRLLRATPEQLEAWERADRERAARSAATKRARQTARNAAEVAQARRMACQRCFAAHAGEC
jgi:hypothetical protein